MYTGQWESQIYSSWNEEGSRMIALILHMHERSESYKLSGEETL